MTNFTFEIFDYKIIRTTKLRKVVLIHGHVISATLEGWWKTGETAETVACLKNGHFALEPRCYFCLLISSSIILGKILSQKFETKNRIILDDAVIKIWVSELEIVKMIFKI